MINAKYSFPEAPDLPMSLWQVLKLSVAAYKGSFRLGLELYWLPCLVLSVANLPQVFYNPGDNTMSLPELLKAAGFTLFSCLGWAFFTLGGVVRTLSLRRMMLVSEDSSAAAIAFANRLGWKAIVARIVTGGLQLLLVNLLLFGWIVAFMRDFGSAPMDALFSAVRQPPGMIGAIVCAAIAYFCWFYIEFWYSCFSTLLAMENVSVDSLLSRAFEMSKSAFWKGCNVTFVMQFVFGLGAYFLSPLALYNLPSLCSFDIESMAHHSIPLAISLADSVTSFLINLFILPFLAIFTAYFANDVRLRLVGRPES